MIKNTTKKAEIEYFEKFKYSFTVASDMFLFNNKFERFECFPEKMPNTYRLIQQFNLVKKKYNSFNKKAPLVREIYDENGNKREFSLSSATWKFINGMSFYGYIPVYSATSLNFAYYFLGEKYGNEYAVVFRTTDDGKEYKFDVYFNAVDFFETGYPIKVISVLDRLISSLLDKNFSSR